MINVTIYYTEGNSACDEVLAILEEIKNEKEILITKININSDFSIMEKYRDQVPLVLVGPYRLTYPLNKTDLLVAINATGDRQEKLGMDENYREKVKRGSEISRTDRLTLWLSRYYILLLNIVLFVYIGLPFLAPVFMERKLELPARVIYAIYNPVCHQLAFRSWFLFGEQAYYPRALAEIPGVKTYEDVTGLNSEDIGKGKEFIGNPTVGYKVALCERDVAIYFSMLLFSLVFMITGRRIKGIPWYIWVGFGMVPMGLDGGSQLFSFFQGIVPFWIPLRESTPLLRSITGVLFGVTTVWYVLPIIEESMIEGRSFILRKVAIINHQDK
ncbi:MAG: DUF2085 domain-containing protein [Anaerolineae bacterium]|nr:DUF2085 domain-containing protein [Anaerolineae bacterium]